MLRNCKRCAAAFDARPAKVRNGRGIYCSRICHGASRRGPKEAVNWASLFAILDAGAVPEPNSGCLLWEGDAHTDGYGLIRRYGRTFYTHRLALMANGVALSSNDCVCHRCDNPACVNPAHLFVGSRKENTLDMWRKGRARPGTPNKLTAEQAAAIREDTRLQRVIAAEYGIAQTMVSQIKRNRTWRITP